MGKDREETFKYLRWAFANARWHKLIVLTLTGERKTFNINDLITYKDSFGYQNDRVKYDDIKSLNID